MVTRENETPDYEMPPTDLPTLAHYTAITRLVDNGMATLEEIKEVYALHHSLFILLRNQTLCERDMQTLMNKYGNLHSLCATKFRHLEADLHELDSIHLLDKCMAVKNHVDRAVYTLQIGWPRDSDTDLRAAHWEVSIQKSMLKNRPQHGNFSGFRR